MGKADREPDGLLLALAFLGEQIGRTEGHALP